MKDQFTPNLSKNQSETVFQNVDTFLNEQLNEYNDSIGQTPEKKGKGRVVLRGISPLT